MKTTFILYSRNDGYKEKERFLIHLKTILDTFDEIIYVDWNSDTHSFLYEIMDDLPKTGKIKHFVITPYYHNLLTNFDPNVQKCNNVLSVNLALRRTDADWIVIGNIDIIPPTREEFNEFLSKADPNTFYTFSRRDISYDEVILNKHRLEEHRKHLNKTAPPQYFPARVTPNDNYSVINCCGDFQLAHKNVWDTIKGLEEQMVYSCFVDTNVQKKAVLNGFGLQAIYDVPVYHMDHKTNRVPQGGDINTMHDKENNSPPKFNDAWKWVEMFQESENDEGWGLANTDIEYEMI
jgi:hypothetical protein